MRDTVHRLNLTLKQDFSIFDKSRLLDAYSVQFTGFADYFRQIPRKLRYLYGVFKSLVLEDPAANDCPDSNIGDFLEFWIKTDVFHLF